MQITETPGFSRQQLNSKKGTLHYIQVQGPRNIAYYQIQVLDVVWQDAELVWYPAPHR